MITRRSALTAIGSSALTPLVGCGGGMPGVGETRNEINRAGLLAKANATVERLSASQPEAVNVVNAAKALLVFPEIVKGGLVVGALGGDGDWFENGQQQDYYRSIAVSYGFQAGITTFGYVMAFMDQASIDYVESSGGWEVGVGPVVTIADEGFAKRFTTTSLKNGVIIFFVNQAGFFAGTGIEGTKITRL